MSEGINFVQSKPTERMVINFAQILYKAGNVDVT